MAVDFKTLEKLLVLTKKHKLAELEIDDGKAKFRIKTTLGLTANAALAPAKNQDLINEAAEAALGKKNELSKHAPESKYEDKYTKVLSPFVGTFYRAPSPDADPYVHEGQVIRKGDALCIIEAMKLMNEIESEISGKIVSILAENGQPVEYGEPLFLVDSL